MKTTIVSLFIGFSGFAQFPPLPGIVSTVDFDEDGVLDVVYTCYGSSSMPLYYDGYYLAEPGLNSVFVLPRRGRTAFGVGESVGPQNPVGGVAIGALLTDFYFQNDPQGEIVGYLGQPGNQNSMTEVLFGVRLQFEYGFHYGWVRFTRPDTKVQTPFAVAESDWNPIAGAPIGAGLPPEVPISFEVPAGSEGLRLTWPAGVASWILESTPSLQPPVQWEPYPAGGTYAEVPLTDEGRYFRLRRP